MSIEKENLKSGEATPVNGPISPDKQEQILDEAYAAAFKGAMVPAGVDPVTDNPPIVTSTGGEITENEREWTEEEVKEGLAHLGELLRGKLLPEHTIPTLDERARIFAASTTEGAKADDYHTVNELYGCRHGLMIALCNSHPTMSFKTVNHSDGTPMFEGYFLLGFRKSPGNQVSFHLPIALWDFANVPELPQAPEFDGHNTQDVIARLLMVGN